MSFKNNSFIVNMYRNRDNNRMKETQGPSSIKAKLPKRGEQVIEKVSASNNISVDMSCNIVDHEKLSVTLKDAVASGIFIKDKVISNRHLFKFSKESVLLKRPNEYFFGYLQSGSQNTEWYVPISKMFLCLPTEFVRAGHPFVIDMGYIEEYKVDLNDLPPMIVTYANQEEKKRLVSKFFACTRENGTILQKFSENGFFISPVLFQIDISFREYYSEISTILYSQDCDERINYISEVKGVSVYITDPDSGVGFDTQIFEDTMLRKDVENSGCIIIDEDFKMDKYSNLKKKTNCGKLKDVKARVIVCQKKATASDYYFALNRAKFSLREQTIVHFSGGLRHEILEAVAISPNPNYHSYVIDTLDPDRNFSDSTDDCDNDVILSDNEQLRTDNVGDVSFNSIEICDDGPAKVESSSAVVNFLTACNNVIAKSCSPDSILTEDRFTKNEKFFECHEVESSFTTAIIENNVDSHTTSLIFNDNSDISSEDENSVIGKEDVVVGNFSCNETSRCLEQECNTSSFILDVNKDISTQNEISKPVTSNISNEHHSICSSNVASTFLETENVECDTQSLPKVNDILIENASVNEITEINFQENQIQENECDRNHVSKGSSDKVTNDDLYDDFSKVCHNDRTLMTFLIGIGKISNITSLHQFVAMLHNKRLFNSDDRAYYYNDVVTTFAETVIGNIILKRS